MNTSRVRGPAVIVALAMIGMLLTGCGQTEAGDNPASTASTEAATAARNVVSQYDGDYGVPTLPTEPIQDVRSLSGRTIVYIPALAILPFFATSFTAYSDAFAQVGVKVTLCDAKSDPAAASACFQQAIDTNAAGVILDTFSPLLAEEAYKATIAAGIPVLLSNVNRPAGSPDTVQFGGPDLSLVAAITADVIIADSDGQAQVATIGSLDNDAPIAWMKAATDEFAATCPTCGVTNLTLKSADIANLPTQVSAALLANGSIDYVLAQFGAYVQPSFQSATAAGRDGIKVASTTTTLGDLQLMATDPNFVGSVSWDYVLNAWMNADLLMRMILGQPFDVSTYTQPIKVFTPDNIKGLDLTQTGWNDSSWYGGDAYKSDLIKLWK